MLAVFFTIWNISELSSLLTKAVNHSVGALDFLSFFFSYTRFITINLLYILFYPFCLSTCPWLLTWKHAVSPPTSFPVSSFATFTVSLQSFSLSLLLVSALTISQRWQNPDIQRPFLRSHSLSTSALLDNVDFFLETLPLLFLCLFAAYLWLFFNRYLLGTHLMRHTL